MITPRQFKTLLAVQFIYEVGEEFLYSLVEQHVSEHRASEESRGMSAGERRRLAKKLSANKTRLIASLRQLATADVWTERDECILELDEKVREAVRFCR